MYSEGYNVNISAVCGNPGSGVADSIVTSNEVPFGFVIFKVSPLPIGKVVLPSASGGLFPGPIQTSSDNLIVFPSGKILSITITLFQAPPIPVVFSTFE